MLDKLKAYAALISCAMLALMLASVGWKLHVAQLDAEKARTELHAEREEGVSGFLCVRLLNPSLNREAAW